MTEIPESIVHYDNKLPLIEGRDPTKSPDCHIVRDLPGQGHIGRHYNDKITPFTAPVGILKATVGILLYLTRYIHEF